MYVPRIYDDDLGNSRTTRYTDLVHRCNPRCCIPAPQRCPLGTDEFSYKLKKGDGWQRKKGYARWVSDVLIFHVGIALIRSDAVQVDMGLFGFQRGLAKSSNCWLFGNGRVLFEDDSRAQFPGQSL